MSAEENKNKDMIGLKSIGELIEEKMKFFIPDYQRGYRWTFHEVRDLLEDIDDYAPEKSDFYCLQPLVVKSCADDSWEVIDGQQRLTTIRILLQCLGCSAEELYSIEYQTRDGSKGFLDSIDSTRKYENLDFLHIFKAKETIEEWLKKKAMDKDAFQKRIKDNVKFIWYEADGEEPSTEVFTRLNLWKIPLTNAELVKALFLNRSNFDDASNKTLQENEGRNLKSRISEEWDDFECTLQNEEFWSFIHDCGYDKPSRLEFILELICQEDKLKLFNDREKSRQKLIGEGKDKVFRYFYEKYNQEQKKEKPLFLECWEEVRKYMTVFKEWFADLEMYHYAGFLIARNKKPNSLMEMWNTSSDRSGFISSLKEDIKNELKRCPDLDFQYKEDGSDKKNCRPILLFHNIQTVIDQNFGKGPQIGIFNRFPFHLYKKENWDVEHVTSATTNPEDDPDTRKEWLLNSYCGLDQEMQEEIRKALDDDGNGNANEDKIKKCYEKVKEKFQQDKEWSQEEKNKIWNYVLLDSSTNRSYGNSIFPAKRRIIISKDQGRSTLVPKLKNGKFDWGKPEQCDSPFVPPCTKRVFLKYYSSALGNNNYWEKSDAEAYLKDIKYCIEQLG